MKLFSTEENYSIDGEGNKNNKPYIINILYNDIELHINIQFKEEKEGENRNEFISPQIKITDIEKKHRILGFENLIQHIKDHKINIEIKEAKGKNKDKIYLKYLILYFKGTIEKIDFKFNTGKIYKFNVEYYLTKGPDNQRTNLEPYSSYIKSDSFNKDDIIYLLNRENISSSHIIDTIRYYDEDKNSFRKLKNETIQINEKIILEFHIKEKKNLLLYNMKEKNKNIIEQIKRMKNKINNYSENTKKYDLIFLYASPIFRDDEFDLMKIPIKYMEEIKIIVDLMKAKGKQFNCKFECANDEVLRDILINNKTKILHISSHGEYDGEKYSITLENLKDHGQKLSIDIKKLESMIQIINKINISQLDLIFLSTCYSYDFGKLLLKNGAKNVIYIAEKTQVVEDVSLFFTKYFYKNLIDGYSIKESYEMAMKSLYDSKGKVQQYNYSSCCCAHYHPPECEFKSLNVHLHDINILESCECKEKEWFVKRNMHYETCPYFKKVMEKIDKKNIKKDSMFNTTIEEGEKGEEGKKVVEFCCCLDLFKKNKKKFKFEHNELLKIIYKSQPDNYGYISSFKLNEKGKLYMNSNIRYYFDEKKYLSVIGRKEIMGKIYKNLTQTNDKTNYSILFGEKGLKKVDFAESFSVYFIERKIIYDYYIYRINTDIDLKNMEHIINNNIKNNIFKKEDINLIIVKFENKNEETNIGNFIKIYNLFCKIEKLYFIFIFDTEDPTEKFHELIKKKLDEKTKNIDNFLFYLKITEKTAGDLFKMYLKKANLKLKLENEEKTKLLSKANLNNKNIEIIVELLNKGFSVKEILEMDKLEIKNKIFSETKNNSLYILYYLLSNMPSGLPKCILNSLFDDYDRIYDEKNFISISPETDWIIINKDIYYKENFKEDKMKKECFEILIKTLKLYIILIKFFIEKNRDKVNYKGGNIHYFFNSYNNNSIWKDNIENAINKESSELDWRKVIAKLLKEKNFYKDCSIIKHKQNILNLISFIANNIETVVECDPQKKKEKKTQIYHILENVLLLFPSYFFLKKNNIQILQDCINFCDKLNTENEEIKKVKNKLLLYLYSIDETKTEILTLIDKDLDKSLEEERKLVKFLQGKKYKTEELNNYSDEKQFFIFYKAAIIDFEQNKYQNSLIKLEAINNSKLINNDFILYRINIDKCYVFRKKFLKKNNENKRLSREEESKSKILIKEKAKLLKKIMKKPLLKDLYYESYNLRNQIYDLLKPDIVMLNSNPLIKKSENVYFPNNQYYILSELKNIESNIRIKSNILNKENLKKALNGQGEILIIQSDPYEEGYITLESEKGESIMFSNDELIQMIPNKLKNYKVIILCFPRSSKLKEYFDKNKIEYKNLIVFEYLKENQNDINLKKEYNKNCIRFIINFIKNTIDKKNNSEISSIFDNTKNQFFNIEQSFVELSSKENSTIKYYEENTDKEVNTDKKVFLYGSLNKFPNTNLPTIDDTKEDYFLKINDLIQHIIREKSKIFYSDIANKRIYLKMSIDAMKYFYRHKTFCELFNFDMNQDKDIDLLISVVEKLNKIRDEKNEESEENEEEEEDEIYQQKACFILIYNCRYQDLIDIDIYSILKSNSSFIIIYDQEPSYYGPTNRQERQGVNIENKSIIIIENLDDNSVFMIGFGYDNIQFYDDKDIKSKFSKDIKEENLKYEMINNKLDENQNGNLYQYLKEGIPTEGEDFSFPLNEDEVKLFFYKILKIVEILHAQHCCHLNINPANIMFDEKFNPFLINLGNAKKTEEEIGDLIKIINEYTPPELYENNDYNGFKVDIFSLGVLLFVLLFRKLPFKFPITTCNLYQMIKDRKFDDYWKNIKIQANDKFKDLFMKMVSSIPDNRISIQNIIMDDYFTETKAKLEKGASNDLENKIYKILSGIRSQIEKIEEEIIVIETKIGVAEKKDIKSFYNKEIEIEKGKPDCKKNNIIKIQFSFERHVFMNYLLSKKFEDNKNGFTFSVSKDKFAAIITKQKDEFDEVYEENEEEARYSIALYQNEDENRNNEYYLKFDYLNGSLIKFYDSIQNFRQLLVNMSKAEKKEEI